MKVKSIFSITIIPLLLIFMLIVQLHVKSKPAIIIALFTLTLIIFTSFKKALISNVLLSILIFFSGTFFWFFITNNIRLFLFPFKQINGHFIEDMKWTYCILISLVFSLLTTIYYFWKISRNKKLELYSLLIYFVTTLIILFNKI